ncbi:hypothetical protein BH09ACT6_BH09ACT6_14090 [soil metagenome]
MTDPNTPSGEGVPGQPPVPAASDTPPPPPAPSAPPTAPPAPPAPPVAPPAPTYAAPPAPTYAAPAAPPSAYAAAPPAPPAAPVYGAPPAQAYGVPAAKSPVLSIIGMVAGILGILISFVSLGIGGFIFSVAAVVLGFLGRRKEPAARGFWLTALITGFAGIALSIILILVFIIAVVSSVNTSYTY